MADERVHRRLAAILAADVVGYSRLMGEDEESTLRTLKSHCEIIDRLIVRHEGRIFGSGGDSVLAEFGSAVEAVRAAISIQEELRVRNTELVEERRMNFRIGINVGDIMVEGDNLFGDGVNVAARLEGVAEPGGICISGSAFDQVKNKLSIGFEDIGLQEVKNIAEPVPAFRVVPGQVSAAAGATPTVAKRWRTPTIAAAVVVILAVGGVAWWQPWVPDEEPASIDEMAFPLPKKPSIAVLPFDNLSGDPKQEYISDGMSENIIAALSRIPAMFVIARNSTFTYKGKPVKVQKVAQELGVRYVLEGSVQRAGDRIRITTQLIDALSGHHLWRLTAGEQARAWRRETESAEAYELFLRGNAVRRTGSQSKTVNAEAQRLYEKSVELDPGFTSAWLWLASTHQLDARYGWSNSRRRSLARAGDAVRKALAIE
jgi:TolB-like protein/class 3 adenylate cyclase